MAEYVEEAKQILGYDTMGLARLGELLHLPREIKIGAWVRLFPEDFEITDRFVSVRDGHRVASEPPPRVDARELALRSVRQRQQANEESLAHAAPIQGSLQAPHEGARVFLRT